ncbi:MAG: sodium-dependent bicarbonate transport family permease [Aphanocapsa feldmannii 277cV]|uniref:Sodium-dependent bicarbonate transport family permease n=2 Tax=Aphanocapsa feldmannii TaxID=192050 RepID=A0A524RLS4_9CHRO|nr:MAG: sodium-dependent bicarbonate transport family permease [Aphanocapsa feldmannii 288cV]TGG91011.1 MAG: sodium-dependent bicarbonate transport family permease [Aphanocapsa feldmannii 277cV]TGH21930.1 MAG: sodium-dependent bicarbonate transport family permease [Aphanocapsa feldmannii 277cI]
MGADLVLQNLLSPPVLFFFLGVAAVLCRSDLEIPSPLPKLFSLYLLLAIGFKGGVELKYSGINTEVMLTIAAAIAMSVAIPLVSFPFLRLRLDVFNAAAIAATYGSISPVTFITAESFLASQGISSDGYMVAALALMEPPAIIVGLLLVMLCGPNRSKGQPGVRWGPLLHEAFLNSSVLLLIGSLMIGLLVASQGELGVEKMKPFTDNLFYGVLSFFLLDMGLVAAKRISDLRKAGTFLIGFSVLMPLLASVVGVWLAGLIGLGQGNALLFTVLCGSASYIAVPAAMRMTVPQANPSLYISSALGLTFPFSIIIGIPLYMQMVKRFIPAF